jgi:NAD(P)-dependent dehydrogenase (short-subunit alcohol dehydrogenase family)/acyl carrier protein
VDATVMGGLVTLGDVSGYLNKVHTQAVSIENGTSDMAATPSEVASAPMNTAPSVDMNSLLFDVVSDKTGYPKEILKPEMALEGDLGIDSIKRVEILSAVKDEAPGLPEVDATVMGGLVTLGDVLDYLKKVLAEAAPVMGATHDVTAQPSQPAPTPMTQEPGPDLSVLLFEVVSDKTGYPKEILKPEMALEGDLGIDSIKRVEILSAMKDEAPGLPEVDASVMGGLVTLGDVLDYLLQANAPASNTSELQPETTIELQGIRRQVVHVEQAEATGFSLAGLTRGKNVIIDDGSEIGPILANLLLDAGISAEVHTEVPDDLNGLIFLGGLAGYASEEEAISMNRRAFDCCRAAASAFKDSAGVFVTVQATGGDFGLRGQSVPHGAWSAGLAGLAKTAALEWPLASVKALDVERGERTAVEVAEAIVSELLYGGLDVEVGLLADGGRLVLRVTEEPGQMPNRTVIAPGDVIIASGGARGVTATCLIELAKRHQPRLVLLGRSPLDVSPGWSEGLETEAELLRAAMGQMPEEAPQVLKSHVRRILNAREIQGTLDAIELAGGQARYLAVDITESDALTEAIGNIRQEWGPVSGIIHGAGVLADKVIAEKTAEQFDQVFRTKVEGLQNLLRATSDDPLKVLCFFSSVAARSGNIGQSDYAMANEVLNKVAAAERMRRPPQTRVVSIGWGPWDGGMVTSGLRSHFESLGISLIPLEHGAKAFVDELARPSGEPVEILIGSPLPRVSLFAGQGDVSTSVDIRVSSQGYPYLDGHRVKDEPVVPVVLVLEWFSRAAHGFYPSLQVSSCQDLKVLRGVTIERFENGGNLLTIRTRISRQGEHPELLMELVAPDGSLHYSATMKMGPADANTGNGTTEERPANLGPWKWKPKDVYKKRLFHRDGFEIIRSLDGVSEEGGTASLVGTHEMGWPGPEWRTDAAALDGGLQLAILWGDHVLGKRSLPTRVGTYRSFGAPLAEGPIQCVLKGKKTTAHRTLSRIQFLSQDGELLAELDDVEMHTLPS